MNFLVFLGVQNIFRSSIRVISDGRQVTMGAAGVWDGNPVCSSV